MRLSHNFSKVIASLLLIHYCSFIFWLSSQTSLPTPLSFQHQDKVMHLGAYFILTAFTINAFRYFISKNTRLLFSSLIFASLYGASDEWHQSFVIGRSSDINDWLADTVGAILFLAIYQLMICRTK